VRSCSRPAGHGPRPTNHGPRIRRQANRFGYRYARTAGKAPGPKDQGPGLTGIRQRPARPYEIQGKPARLQGLDYVGQGAAGLVNCRRKKTRPAGRVRRAAAAAVSRPGPAGRRPFLLSRRGRPSREFPWRTLSRRSLRPKQTRLVGLRRPGARPGFAARL
jgi:hypothetical protein